jgi:antitoxin VapB
MADRRDAVLDVAERHGAHAMRLGRFANFAWYTDGGDNRVDRAADRGAAEIVVTADGQWVVTTNIEAERLRQEQVPGFDVVAYDWWQGPDRVVEELTDGATAASDESADVAADLASLRLVLDAAAQARYRTLGADARVAIEEAAASITPNMTELAAAAHLTAACLRRAMQAPVLLAAGAERVAKYRHPLPTANRLGDHAMLVVSAERGGLYANLTRFVFFGSAELPRGLSICEDMLNQMRAATTPGRMLGEVFAHCQAMYADAGWEGEWRHHHQGGITGYQSREVIATPDSQRRIEAGMAFAWNPSVPGAKAEETFLLTADGPEVLTGKA